MVVDSRRDAASSLKYPAKAQSVLAYVRTVLLPEVELLAAGEDRFRKPGLMVVPFAAQHRADHALAHNTMQWERDRRTGNSMQTWMCRARR